MTKHHTPLAYKLFLAALEAGKLRSGCQHGQILVTAIFQAAHGDFSLYRHMADSREKKQTLVTLVQALISHPGALPKRPCLSTDYLPRAPPPHTVTLGSKVSTLELVGEEHNVQSVAMEFFHLQPKDFSQL